MAPRWQQPTLVGVHAAINACTVCLHLVRGFHKPEPMSRGSAGPIVFVGQEPGNTERTSGRAFSGQSGSRLDEWLVKCGFEPDDPRAAVYLTSVIKCPAPTPAAFPRMARRCRHFLDEQLAAVRPRLVITLGAVAYRELAITNEPFEDAVCRFFDTRDEPALFAPRGFDYRLLPWPHPSGRNRWLNSQENRDKLAATFPLVRAELENA